MSVTVCLEDEIDISRGDMLVTPSRMPHVSRRFEATIVWMHQSRLQVDRPYLLKHTTQQVTGNCHAVLHTRQYQHAGEESRRTKLELNEIGVVSIETHKPLFFDAYRKNRATGSFHPDRSGDESDRSAPA